MEAGGDVEGERSGDGWVAWVSGLGERDGWARVVVGEGRRVGKGSGGQALATEGCARRRGREEARERGVAHLTQPELPQLRAILDVRPVEAQPDPSRLEIDKRHLPPPTSERAEGESGAARERWPRNETRAEGGASRA